MFVASERRFARRVVIEVLAPELAAPLQQANIVPVFDAGEAAVCRSTRDRCSGC